MAEERPEKTTVRELWVESVAAAAASAGSDAPLYLTLPGAEGRDVQLLIDRGLLRQTETGAIHVEDLRRVVAVEFNSDAIAALQRRFPGLRILEDHLENVLRSTRLTAWPTGEHREFLRARVINLDLNAPLDCQIQESQLRFPIVELVRKIAFIHAEPSPIEWTLCLTLNATITWDPDEGQLVRTFFQSNFDVVPEFEEAVRDLLGDELHATLFDADDTDLGALDGATRQLLLMSIVPKAIASVVHQHGWRVETVHNLSYGGTGDRAPMVTWIVSFQWDPRSSTQASIVYRESLRLVHANCGAITADGTIEHLSPTGPSH